MVFFGSEFHLLAPALFLPLLYQDSSSSLSSSLPFCSITLAFRRGRGGGGAEIVFTESEGRMEIESALLCSALLCCWVAASRRFHFIFPENSTTMFLVCKARGGEGAPTALIQSRFNYRVFLDSCLKSSLKLCAAPFFPHVPIYQPPPPSPLTCTQKWNAARY